MQLKILKPLWLGNQNLTVIPVNQVYDVDSIEVRNGKKYYRFIATYNDLVTELSESDINSIFELIDDGKDVIIINKEDKDESNEISTEDSDRDEERCDESESED